MRTHLDLAATAGDESHATVNSADSTAGAVFLRRRGPGVIEGRGWNNRTVGGIDLQGNGFFGDPVASGGRGGKFGCDHRKRTGFAADEWLGMVGQVFENFYVMILYVHPSS